MRRCYWLWSGMLGLAIVGCEEPPQVVQTNPPGAIVNKIPESEKGDKGPQAIGEQHDPKASPQPEPTPIKPAPPTAPGESKELEGGVKYETLKAGNNVEVKSGQTVLVKYTGTLDDGKVFDSRTDTPVPFILNYGQLVPGFLEGVVGMHVGEKRKIFIPSKLAYGERGKPPVVPGNANLNFEVEVVSISQ